VERPVAVDPPPRAAALALRLRVRVLLSLLAGILGGLSFPPFPCAPLAFVALVPILIALRGATTAQALLFGWACPFGKRACGV